MIYARKESLLLKDTLKEMGEVLTSGDWSFNYLVNIEQRNNDAGVKYINNLFIELINFKQSYYFTGPSFCKNYQVVSIDKNAGEYLLRIDSGETLKAEVAIDK